MSARYDRTPLADLADDVRYGYTASASPVPVGPRFLRITDIVPDFLDWESVPYCEIEVAERAKYTLLGGDLVIARTGASVGYAKYIKDPPDAVFASYLVRVRVNARCDPRFVGYAVTSNEYKRYILANAGGAAQPNANARVLTSYPVPLPPLPVQRRIASILSAYDDLIKNNTRRIQILEEMAQAIYREWFVEFRFPGHEGVRMVDSELGPIPEGWRVSPFSELAEFVNGYAFKPTDWVTEGLPIVKIKELKDGVTVGTPRHPAGALPEKYLVRSGDLLFSWSADLDAYIWSHGPAWLNQHLFNVLPRDGMPRLFLFHAIRGRMDEFRSRALGTTMRHIKRSALGQVLTAVPDARVVACFEAVVQPMDLLRLTLTAANRNLRATRDLLLPRLISGEIDVSRVDIGDTEPAGWPATNQATMALSPATQ